MNAFFYLLLLHYKLKEFDIKVFHSQIYFIGVQNSNSRCYVGNLNPFWLRST